ncbi:MAG: isoprenyl transferase [Gammaproteobacteria bacterium]|nr:isoprenyl transferase [Gammaproteobacteria bacterium]
MKPVIQDPIKSSTEYRLPRHVAIIMDGNGRWAQRRHLPRFAGHRAGVAKVRELVETCAESGIEVLTLFAFSSENWRRPVQEVSLLMDLLWTSLKKEIRKLHKNNIRVRFIGDRHAFASRITDHIDAAEALTAENTGLTLVVAVNYGGRWDILQSVRSLACAVSTGELDPEQVDVAEIESRLSLHDLPDPDLFIRTGGERRISNFLLWQLAYSELYFTDTLWPDFDQKAFRTALDDFAGRQRRFGMTGDQVETLRNA